MKNQLKKIKVRLISGSPLRKTRLHDIRGNVVPFSRLLLHGPRATLTGLLRVLFGYRPERPWISYSAAAEIEAYLDEKSVVLEYGSGMSTVWLAKRCARLYSVEDNETWHRLIDDRLSRYSLKNVTLEYSPDEDVYCNFPADDSLRFDLLFIDGLYREKCLKNALRLLKPGGLVFLDDTDKGKNGKPSRSDLYLREMVERQGGWLHYYTDFSPTEFAVTQCALARIP